MSHICYFINVVRGGEARIGGERRARVRNQLGYVGDEGVTAALEFECDTSAGLQSVHTFVFSSLIITLLSKS